MRPSYVRDAVRSLRPELYELARSLVRHRSVTGSEDDAQEALASRLEAWGFEVDLWTVEPAVRAHRAFCDDGLPVERKNLVATWGEGGKSEPAALVLNGHIDVVPEGDRKAWRFDPYDGVIDAGALHGRGACDMKAGLAAAVIAVRAVMKLGLTPKRPIQLHSVVGEETGGLGTLAAILRGYRGDGVVITEPTGLSLCPVQAGALSFRLHVHGKAAHGAMRASGVSAIEKFTGVLDALGALESNRHRDFVHPSYDKNVLVAPLSVGKLSAGNWPSTVPETLVAEGRYGVFPGEDCGDARKLFEETIEAVSRHDTWLRSHPVEVEWVEGQFEPGETSPGAPILEALATCHEDITGSAPTSHGVTYGSDLRLFTRHADMPAVLYGPGDVRLAHATNESVPLEEVLRAAEVLALLVTRCLDGSAHAD